MTFRIEDMACIARSAATFAFPKAEIGVYATTLDDVVTQTVTPPKWLQRSLPDAISANGGKIRTTTTWSKPMVTRGTRYEPPEITLKERFKRKLAY